ncbi:hypothetical protein [Chelativorans sp. YIM 93263]|uniref:hypothetical protein n=1 Tax=Chelativorans sp. YIM 93263 TaxID=2906648 RepID=UPI002378194F|nr:hypothetical protein [Chelativorans sp. YIM 93263]
MKLLLSLLIVLGTAGAVALVHEGEPEETLTTAAIEKAKDAEYFQMRIPGRDGSCKLIKRGPVDASQSQLELGENCSALMPRLAEARYWRERDAGDVTLLADDGRTIVEFFPGDGVAYESYSPETPLIALTAQ